MGWWTVGVMPDNDILHPLLVQSVPPKPGWAKRGKVPTSKGVDSKPDAEPAVHNLDDAGNYLKYAIFLISNNIA
jgi:hypothetical protein